MNRFDIMANLRIYLLIQLILYLFNSFNYSQFDKEPPRACCIVTHFFYAVY